MVTVEEVNVIIHGKMHPTENVMMVELVQPTITVAEQNLQLYDFITVQSGDFF